MKDHMENTQNWHRMSFFVFFFFNELKKCKGEKVGFVSITNCHLLITDTIKCMIGCISRKNLLVMIDNCFASQCLAHT